MAAQARAEAATLARWVRPGSTVALADGVGFPAGLCGALSAAAREAGGVRLILGWCPQLPPDLDLGAFADVRSFMPGASLREHVAAGTVHYVPAYLSQLPALLAGAWRPDVLLLSAAESDRGLTLASEVSWISCAARHAGICVAEINNDLPVAARPGTLAGARVEVVAECARPPVCVPSRPPDAVSAQIGARLAALVPPRSAVQFGPGPIALAFLAALEVPVRIDSGIATDAIVDLDIRGLLAGVPLATYLSGTERLYRWASGREILDGIETTHQSGRLESLGLVAVNTALQIDPLGQVALDDTAHGRAAGIGGHGDYALAASRSPGGLSIIALPSARRGRSALAERLDMPVATPRSAVDMVVTEHGHADLRGLDDAERAAAIRVLFS